EKSALRRGAEKAAVLAAGCGPLDLIEDLLRCADELGNVGARGEELGLPSEKVEVLDQMMEAEVQSRIRVSDRCCRARKKEVVDRNREAEQKAKRAPQLFRRQCEREPERREQCVAALHCAHLAEDRAE